jgi:DNA processing protein
MSESTSETLNQAADAAVRAPAPVEPAVYAAALAGLPRMTPARLVRVLDGFDPTMAWHALVAGTHPGDLERRFASAARTTDVAMVGDAYRQADVSILLRDTLGYPTRLVGDRGQPAVLFAQGDPTCVDRRASAAIVGTRSATPYGQSLAAEIAGDLSAAGVVVVSGLAKGIDGAAHTGVVRRHDRVAEPVAVVGTGLDVVYPPSQAKLWSDVADGGAILSEAPLGTPPLPGVFPARNRIIAALSDVVIVVESHLRGGSLYTADAAARRGIPVGAVPGSVRSKASSGTNALIADGCFPVRDAVDVLCAIDLTRAEPVTGRSARHVQCRDRPRKEPTVTVPTDGDNRSDRDTRGAAAPAGEEERRVLEAVDDHPTGIETILLRTGLPIASVALACEELVERDALIAGPGWWSRA